jgi:hypothetical protein
MLINVDFLITELLELNSYNYLPTRPLEDSMKWNRSNLDDKSVSQFMSQSSNSLKTQDQYLRNHRGAILGMTPVFPFPILLAFLTYE